MVYRTSRCPNCRNIVRKETNPIKVIGNPFEQCPCCGAIYKNKYKAEWITKSPIKRFLFFLEGVIAKGIISTFIVWILIFAFLYQDGESEPWGLFFTVWVALSVIYIIIGYNINKERSQKPIEESLERTESSEYVELLKTAGYKIYPIKDKEIETK